MIRPAALALVYPLLSVRCGFIGAVPGLRVEIALPLISRSDRVE